MKTIDRVIKTTEKAHLVEIANKRYWIPNKFIEDDQVNDSDFKMKEVEIPKVKIKAKIEDYTDLEILIS